RSSAPSAARCRTTATGTSSGRRSPRAGAPARAPAGPGRAGRRLRPLAPGRGAGAPASRPPGAASASWSLRRVRSSLEREATGDRRGAHRVSTRRRSTTMPTYMDVHDGFVGVTREALEEAHQHDLDAQDAEGVSFDQVWADPASGKVFCLATGPDIE